MSGRPMASKLWRLLLGAVPTAPIGIGLFIPVLAASGAFTNHTDPGSADGAASGDPVTSVAGTTAQGSISAFVTVADPDGDADGDTDGLILSLEITNGCLDTNPDSDGDGLTDGQDVILLGTDCAVADSDGDGFSDAFEMSLTGAVTGATAATLVDADSSYPQPPASPNSTWTAGQWTGFFVSITAGTGAAQIRHITANTADTLTIDVADPWTTVPDATSTYAIHKVQTLPLVDCAADGIADNEAIDASPPDLNDDQSVNILDTFKFFPAWLTTISHPAWGPRLDLNADGSVNILDTFVMFPVWLQTCTP